MPKYDLKKSKDVLGPLYPRLLDKQGREINGFHRETASSDWPTRKLDQIDTDVKYWTARIVANAHRRTVSRDERKKDIIELAKALRDEGQEGSLVNVISELTTFSERYIRGLLIDHPEYKQESMAREIAELSSAIKQKPKRKTKHDTTDKQKLEKLYKQLKNSAYAGQKPTCQSLIDKAKDLGGDVRQYEADLGIIRVTLNASLGRKYEEVKDSLNEAFEKSKEMKKALKNQIKTEKDRVKKSNVEIKEEVLRDQKFLEQVENKLEKKRLEELNDKNEEQTHVGLATGEFEWYTPKNIIEAARKLMKTVDVDPASSDIANYIIKATTYYTIEDNGLKQEWRGNVWMNPPYSQPLVTQFCNLLVEKHVTGEVKQACVLVNNATETEFYQNMMKHCNAICFIKGRVKFIDTEGNPNGAPLQGQTILYFGENITDFSFIFSEFGVVLHAKQ